MEKKGHEKKQTYLRLEMFGKSLQGLCSLNLRVVRLI